MKNKDYNDLSGKDENLSGKEDVLKQKYEEFKDIDKKKFTKDMAEAIMGVDSLNIDENINEEELKKQVNEIVSKVNQDEKSNIVIPEQINLEQVDYNKYEETPENADFNNYKETPKNVDYNKYEETPENADYNNYNTEEAIRNGKDKKGVNFVFLFLIVIAIVIFITMFLGTTLNFKEKEIDDNKFSQKTNTIDNDIAEGKTYSFGKDKKIFENVEFEMEEDYLGNHILLITNKSDVEYKNRKVYIVFTDGENNVITIKDEYVDYMPKNSTVAIEIYEIENNFEDYLVYFDTKVDEYDYYDDYYLQGIGFSDVWLGDYGTVYYTLKNTAEEKIDNASYTILLYNGEDLVYFEEEYIYDLKAGKEEEKNLYLDEEIEFTNAEFIINNIKFK